MPSTEWLKIENSGIITIREADAKHKFEDNRTTLVIRNINKLQDHKIRYRCVITNGVMPDLVKEITVKVASVSMTLDKLPSRSSAYNGTEWTLLCNVQDEMDKDAQKEIKMTWLKDSKTLKEIHSPRVKLQRGKNKLRLVVNPLKFEDEGTYTCQVSDGNKLTKSTTTKLEVLQQRVEFGIFTSNPTLTSSRHTETIATSTENLIVLMKDHDEKSKKKQADAVMDSINEMEQIQLEKMKKGADVDLKVKAETSKDAADTTTINQLVIFVVPGAVVIILLIAVVSTIIAYIIVKRSAKRNSRSSESYRRPESSTTYDNDYSGRKKNVLYIPSDANSSIDRRYGRLKSSSLNYGNNAAQNAYEIPDYCSGIKPYSTLQIDHNTRNKLLDDRKRDSQCSV
ncbi:Uncharacterised protein r2_g1304 [Pycnogonum litorale]